MWNHLRGKDVTLQVLTLNSYFKLYVYKLIELTYIVTFFMRYISFLSMNQ